MRKTDIICRRCGYTATITGKPPDGCPGCGIGTKPKDVLEFERNLEQMQSQLMFHAMSLGWPARKLAWKKYPSSDNRLDLMCETTRLALIRVEFEPPSITSKWVGPELQLTAEQVQLESKLEEAHRLQTETGEGPVVA